MPAWRNFTRTILPKKGEGDWVPIRYGERLEYPIMARTIGNPDVEFECREPAGCDCCIMRAAGILVARDECERLVQ